MLSYDSDGNARRYYVSFYEQGGCPNPYNLMGRAGGHDELSSLRLDPITRRRLVDRCVTVLLDAIGRYLAAGLSRPPF